VPVLRDIHDVKTKTVAVMDSMYSSWKWAAALLEEQKKKKRSLGNDLSASLFKASCWFL
jgi:hypothetical protein